MRPAPTIDQQIVAALFAGPEDLHTLVLCLWPDLEDKPREVALSAIYYLRARVDCLIAGGVLASDGGRLALAAQPVEHAA